MITKGLRDGEGVTIAHLDTGWTYHNDLDINNFDFSRVKDFIEPNSNAEDPLNYSGNPGHGTKTGSVMMSGGGVSATGTLPAGEVTGVAREVIYVPIRCINSVVIIFNSDVARAISHATASKCDVISMSLGGRPMKAMELALENATDHDLVVVNAAGNNVRVVVWPARYPKAIAVAGSNYLDKPWSGSSRGKRVDISAPGESVYFAEPDPHKRNVGSGNGTSYATANLAGVAALWLAFHQKTKLQNIANNSGANLQELFRFAIKSTARQPSSWDQTKFGAGIVQVESLLQFNLNTISKPLFKEDTIFNQGYLYNDDELSLHIKEIYLHSNLKYYDFLKFFGNEVSGLILNMLDQADEAEDANGIEIKSTFDIINFIKKNGSSALKDILFLLE